MPRSRRMALVLAALVPLVVVVVVWLQEREAAKRATFHRREAPDLRSQGISGVARDDLGRYWAVSEERHELVRFSPSWDLETIERVPITGIAHGLELESMAWLGEGIFAVGTETDDERDEDAILVVRVDGGGARVVGSSHLSWRSEIGVAAPHNAGVEGICAAGGRVLAAGEMALGDPRSAPLALAPYDGTKLGPWLSLSLRLSSATGKISALDCAEDERGSLVVHAVERHYGVTRVLRFEIPESPTDGVIIPDVVSDVSAIASDVPNVEGLIVEDDRFVLLSDHDADQRVGTTEILSVPRAADGSVLTVLPTTAGVTW